MNIFESLENLNVSEECFENIINIVEEIINENSVDDYYQGKIKGVKGLIKRSQKESGEGGQPANTKELRDRLNKLIGFQNRHNRHVSDSKIPAKKSVGLGDGKRAADVEYITPINRQKAMNKIYNLYKEYGIF